MTVIDDSTSLALTLIGVIAAVALYVWIALALSAVFRKSGEEPWKAWVPVLNLVVLLQLGGLSGWLLLLGLVPFLGIVAVWVLVIIACHRIGAAFGYGPGMTVLAALLLPVWATVIGFGSSRWVGAETGRGVRRTPADLTVDDTGLPALPDYGRPADAYAPISPPPAYGRSQPGDYEPSQGGCRVGPVSGTSHAGRGIRSAADPARCRPSPPPRLRPGRPPMMPSCGRAWGFAPARS